LLNIHGIEGTLRAEPKKNYGKEYESKTKERLNESLCREKQKKRK
jgi:hypothetical protein